MSSTWPDGSARKWPACSVVMSTYNRPDRLRKAVQCVLDQTFTDYELLVVDDGSHTAHTALDDFSEKFAARGIRLGVIGLEENSGYQALPKNIGIAYARGAFIALADDDDEWYPWHLETLIGEIRKGDADVVYGRWDFGGQREGETWPFVPFNHLTAELVVTTGPRTNFISVACVFSKAAMIAALGPKVFDEELRRFGDWDVWRRAILSGLRFRGVDRATFKYMWHGENLQLTRPVTKATVQARNKGGAPWDGKVLR